MTKCHVCAQPIEGTPGRWFCNVPMHAECQTETVRFLIMESAADMAAVKAVAQLCLDLKRGMDTREALRAHFMGAMYAGFVFGATFPQDVMTWARETGREVRAHGLADVLRAGGKRF